VKKDWIQEGRKRFTADYNVVIGALLAQRAVASEHVRKSYRLSKTELQKRVQQQDAWFQTILTERNTLNVVLERHWLLGRVVWWLCDRFGKRANKPPTMQKVDGTVPIEQRKSPKGASGEVVNETAGKAVPVA
jgi:hypothetical protein